MGRLRRIASILLVFIMVATGILVWLFRASLPEHAGSIGVDGIDAPVVIERDRLGIPHVFAGSERDAYFAVGFAHAQDRLWQLELNRRVAAGRMSELLGERTLGIDRFMRTLGLYRRALASVTILDADTVDLLQAYADGINAFLETRADPLPPEFQILWHEPEPWTVADSLVWPRMMALDLSKNWADEALRARLMRRFDGDALADLMPRDETGGPVSIPAGINRAHFDGASDAFDRVLKLADAQSTPGLGSNIFAVSAEAGANGAAMLANDPHLRLASPSVWYMARLRTPELDVAGATIPGMPFVVIGRNADIAWGFTASGVDVQDLVLESIDPKASDHYLTAEGSEPFDITDERIGIRFGEPEHLRVRTSRNGPILSDIGAAPDHGEGHAVALRWTALEEDDRTIEAGFDLAHARNPDELRHALADFHAPPMNVVFADRAGHIGLVLAGRVPIRSSTDGSLPADGRTADPLWTGFIPSPDLPHTLDPPAGRLINANNPVIGPEYPYHLAVDWDPDLRARRLEQLLAVADPDADTLAAAQNDAHSTLADDFLPLLLNAPGPPPRLVPLIERLRRWNRRMDRDAVEPLIFASWYRALVRAVLADELGTDFARFEGIRARAMHRIVTGSQGWCDDVSMTDAIETCEDRAIHALGEAVEWLGERFGEDVHDWRWEMAQPVVMKHMPFDEIPLIRRLFSIETVKNGDSSSPDVAIHSRTNPFEITAAASMRMLVDWANPSQMLLANATGQSGHPLSVHHRDMTPAWRDGHLSVLRMTAGPSPEGASRRLEISPKTKGMRVSR